MSILLQIIRQGGWKLAEPAVIKSRWRMVRPWMLAGAVLGLLVWIAIVRLERDQQPGPAAPPDIKTSPPMIKSQIRFDPQPTLMKVECPVLALHGDTDLHAHPKNLLGIQQALKAGGNEACTIKELPGLNHLFQTCQTGLPSEYARIEETFAPSALELIGDWVKKSCIHG